ncbi:hypothetical protein HBI70_027010 [Parastagonospora nodorum]|nr:hypothetical protein HBI10_107440 [Parastagonospora nodorum]KAH4022373.1 hypothetical protein HBI13_101760 [Parastagonospora nodorum]KAH5286420.1 hypothetical protein HBI70_027010 [Parastagonospora nodorum]KAH5612794.1 hypothetical protein HBI45_043820 [Parastagonospora nodorum]
MLSIINEAPTRIEGPDLLHDLVAPSSSAVAIDFLENGSKRRKFSYKTLHTLSDAIAQNITRSLEKLENASAIIPVLLPQCPELYIVLLAILKAGRAFCPLNLDTPTERLNFILEDISAGLIITTSACGGHLATEKSIIKMYIDEIPLHETTTLPPTKSNVNTNALAYVLYTSGSTGLPKAVSVSHRAVTQSLLAHDRHIPHFSRFLQFAAPTFDVSIFETFFPFYRGCTLTSRTRVDMLNNLPETMHLLDVDAAELTPTVVSNLLHGRASVPGLKLLLTIGEMLTQDVVEEYGGTDTQDSILWAMYGPTEAAIHCTLQPRMMSDASTQTIGFPLDTVSVFVVAPLGEGDISSSFSILPAGQEGELAVGGPQVAEEYLNRPELTAKAFTHHPEYGYVYRTGDRARLLSNGTIMCLGRVATGQVKFRGQRVELGEIEQTVLKLDGCRAATVMVIEESLVAFCATGSRELSSADVIQTCKQWLPQVMIPSDVIFMQYMPQLPSGKIDQKSLVAMYKERPHHNGTKTAYLSNGSEHKLLDLLRLHLKQSLNQESILASAGLDSLRAIRLATVLRASGYQLSAIQILSATTVGDLVRIAKDAKRSNGIEPNTATDFQEFAPRNIPELEQRLPDIACILPCTPLQEALLTETAINPSAYCNWVEVELSQRHSFERIQAALLRLAHDNEILRSGFHPADSEKHTFMQVIWERLEDSHVQNVRNFTKTYALSSHEFLLRPLFVQVMTHRERPRLLFQIHHALYDGWSMDLMLQDLMETLDGLKVRPRPQYREIIKYHIGYYDVLKETDKMYWTDLLRDRSEVMLPNYNGKVIDKSPARSLSGRSTVNIQTLHARSQCLMISPQVYFQAAVAYVQSLYLGTSDVVIGNVTSGRTIPVSGIEDIIGPCIASLPFRLHFTQLPKALNILRETHRLNREALTHCALPLREIAKAVSTRRATRLFDVLFVWQQALQTASTTATSAHIIDSADELEFKLTLEFEPRSDHISYRATFDPSTIPEHQVNYLFWQIDAVVDLFLENVDCATADIAMCFQAELHSIANPVPRQISLHHGPAHAVEQWASTTPDREALVMSHRVNGSMQVEGYLTYAALNRLANQVARVLIHQGACPDCLVGVIMDKSINLYVAILAVLKIGAGYLPLVPDLPRERTKLILNEAQVTLCISESSASAHLDKSTSSKTINLDKIDVSLYLDDNLGIPYDGASVAYAVFTSGSTGTPKGVLVTHENLMSNLSYLSTVYPYSEGSKLLQSCSQAFDVSVFEIFFSWHVGICLCTARKDDLFSDLEGAINQLGITHLSLTPTVAALIDPDNVPQVKFLVTAGEAVTEHVRRKWAGRGLYQGYGPSETTNICTVRSSVSTSDLINNIGKPFDNTSAFVLDPTSETVLPRGAVGELCFGGYQVFQGYLNRPDLTAAKIINHPTYGRLYRSGDLGVMLADESILFTGRLDDQVKIRGQRVELGEISSTILDHGCVRDCTTLLLRDSSRPEILVTFWVPSVSEEGPFKIMKGRDFHAEIISIFDSLLNRLPAYMVPSYLVPVSRLPMTAQGKIDKRNLGRNFRELTEDMKAGTTVSQDVLTDEIGLSTSWEIQVADHLAEILGISVENINRNSSFFQLGLDSVSAIKLSNRLRKETLGDFTISAILKNPTVAHLEQLKAKCKRGNHTLNGTRPGTEDAIIPSETARIRTWFDKKDVAIAKIYPCTPLQEAMLSTGHSTATTSYSNVMAFFVKGDVLRLQQCWALMAQRHEILRTSFVATSDPSHAFAQVVLQDANLIWDEITWTREAFHVANKTVADLLQVNKPPVWLALARSNTSTRLLFCCHHAVYDGIAIQTLLNEVQEAYRDHKLPSPLSYDVYLQQMLLQNLAEADQFWTATFQDFEPTAFPDLTGRVHKELYTAAAWRRQLQLPLSTIRQACQNTSMTLLSVIHATWAKLLHYYTGESDACFGNVVSGRALSGHDLDRLVAPCFNTLPVRINFDFSNDNLALAQQVHTFNVESIDFQLTPLRRIQGLVLKDGGRLFDTLVILQQQSEPLDTTIWELEEDRGVMDLPLVCEISQNDTEDRLDLILHYHDSILSEREVTLVAETFEASLATIIHEPHAPAHDTISFPKHLQAESNCKLKDPEIRSQFLHSGLERNAEASPKRIALDFLHADGTRTTWSFQSLNDRANGIARMLMNLGVKPEDIIPVHIPKSPSFYASILGILKAGAAFAPIHPGLPEARRKLMLQDLGAQYVLCTAGFTPPTTTCEAILVDAEGPKTWPEGNPAVKDLTSSNLAYCIFTSGSTGVPKAVSMEHSAPIQTIECSKSLVPWTTSSRLLQYAATTFDMCYYDCFLAWTLGFTLCAAEQDTMLNDLSKMINILDSDLLDLTPSVAASLERCEVPNVKWLYCIGEAMTSNIVKEWEGACVNSYGPSEAAFCTTICPVSQSFKPSVIGRPFSSTEFAIFPSKGDGLLPLLSVGELYIGGTQLARGYHGRPELTKEKFVTRSGRRFYRSGDVVRMLSDGNFEFIGRTDDQIKIRGLRVELGEINNILHGAHPDVQAAATQIMRKDDAAKEQLVAFLVAKRSVDEVEGEEIRRQLRQVAKDRLPLYMVPQFFIFVDKIHRSLAGKIDKKALTEIFRISVDANSLPNGISNLSSEHQWTIFESRIRDVFAHLSSSAPEDISPTTTIYQLGLDSISAVQVAAVLRREGHLVNAADVMRYLTCTDLAAFLNHNAAAEQPAAATFDFQKFDTKHRPSVLASCNVANEDIVAIRPCTPLQRGMISQMLAKEGAIYINYLRLDLKPGTDTNRLKKAWEIAAHAHMMLRTGFAHIQDKSHSFGMIEYAPNCLALPWDAPIKNAASVATEVWLEKLQREMARELHRPLWHVRIGQDNHTQFLDLVIFHGLFDAQSLQSVFQDVIAAYHDQQIESPVGLDPIIDGVLQRSTAYGDHGKEFWTQLGKQGAPCRFPNLAPLRYKPQSSAVRTHRSSRSLSDIEGACRQANTTLQAAGVVSWLSLIAAYTGETFATCGVVLSGRDFEIAESAVFPCINTVPVSHKVTEDTEQMLSAITKLMAEVQQHQHIPLNDIQRLMGFSNEPLFDTIFAYQKLSTRKDLNNIWNIVDERATIEYPLSIELEPKGDFLEYRLTFLPHLIPQGQAKVMLEQLDHLLECFISHGKAANIADMTLYSIAPAMEPELPSEAQFLHDFVESTAMKYPGRVAFEFANSIHEGENHKQRWTYSQLNAEGNRVANLLIANAVQPGDLVCVCFDKCPEASFAMLGILKAGAAFVAIDPGAPAARQAFITRDSGATAVLSMSAQSAQFIKDVQVPVLNLDETKPSSYSSAKPSLGRDLSPQDRSYCLYTSGTTGTPKACELTHENAVQALLAFQRLFDGHWNSESRWLQFASFHFDVSVLEQYWSWSVGICVVSAPRDVIFEDLADSINTLDITHIDLTPSLAQILHPDDVPSLCKGVFITGGESLKQEILNVWGPKGVIYNGYGPTEATIGCTMYTRVPANGKPSNIGKQFDNVGTFVLKPGTDIPVLRGGVGELCVSGKLVGKGYLKRKDLTAKGFPHLKRFNERVYRTGDLVRILYDGTFDFLGRADDQVKLRGQRLEIGEINSVIRQSNKSISDVATLVLKHPGQQKEQLVTFVIHGQATRQCNVLLASASEMMTVRDACHDNLPPYMIPTHFVPLTSMPLNINNKADAKKLKELYESLSAADLSKLSTSSDEYNQSWSDEERRLQDVLIKELHVNEDTIGKETSFFELGMDSISVIDVVRAMKQAGITSVTASLIMKHSTIRRLAKALSDETHRSSDRASVLAAQQAIAAMQHRHRRAVARALSISTHDIEAVAPCTPLQQGMIARSLDNDNGLYFNTFVFQLSKEINHEKLRAAWQVVHASAQILRTVFANTEDGYVQVVLRDVGSPWASNQPQHPYKGESLNGCLSRIHGDWVRSNTDQFGRPFELRLVQTQEKQILVIHIFHGLYDGISIELIFKAVWDAYNGRESNDIAPSFLSALPHGPLKVLDGAKAFWQEQISQDVSSHFLTRPPADFSGKVTKVTREMQDLGALESTRRKLNVTAQAIAQACWLDVLKGHVKAALTIGIVVSGRSIDLENADRIMGPMFNTIPYQNSPQHSETWESLIKRVHDFNVAAHPYQHTPLRDIMKWCKVDRSQSLFDNLFVYQVAQTSQACIKNDFWELLDGDTVADYPLAFEVEQGPNEKWSLTLVAQNHVLDEATSNVLLDRFEGALHQALTEPTATLETLLPPNGTIETIPEASNGLILPLNGTEKFAWTKEANVLRESLAELTSSELQSIDQSTSVFELGLDSIDAIKLSSKLKKQGIDLPVSGIMRGLTIAKMLAHIKRPADIEEDEISNDSEFQARKHELVGHAKRQGFSTDQIENVLPLTPLQEAMVVEMITSEFTRYYNFDVMKIDQDTDIERLKVAWTLVVQATPILRTSFVEVEEPDIEESYAQIIHAKPHPFWKEKTLDSEPDFSALFEEVRQEVSNAKSSSPPFHILLIRSTGQNYLLLAIAHALYDGWSLGLLHADVKSAYDGILKPRPSYQKTLSKILTRPEDNASDFWGDYLDQAEPSAFKRRPRAAKEKTDTVHRAERESTVSAASLTEFAKKSNVSLQTLGQSVFAVVLASYVQSLDVVFGSVLSGRDDETTLQLLFPTMNTIVVRTILHGTRIELVRHVQENFTSLKQWQHFPLRQALECAGQNGGLFESLFIYQKSMRKIEDLRPLYTSIAGHSDVEYPVCVEMEVVDGRLLWRCAVKDEVFDEDSAQELLDRLDRVLSEIMLQPDSPVIDFTSQGTSLCGLPPFDTDGRKDTVPAVRWSEITGQRQGQPREETIFAIREALAITAELSDEDVTDEMTIFHIGLDSISAIKVSSLLRKKRIILSVGDMLRAGTVINMARVADARFSQQPEQNKNTTSTIKHALQGLDHDDILNRANSEECMIKSLEEVQILPATAGQTYMLSMWLNTRGSNFFPEFTYSLSGKVSFRKLQDAWTSLVATSPILRTYIIAMQDPLVPYLQLVRKTEGNESRVFEITEHAEEKSSTGQPWAQLYAAQAEDGWTLKLKIHHALYDGVSLPILMQQLQAICNNGTEPRPNKTFEELVASSLGSQLRNSFWKSYFDGVSQTRLSQPQRSVNIRSEVFIPSLMPTKALEDSARQNGISIQALFLACYARLYATLTKTPPEQDIILGIYLANRSLPISGIESAAIPTVNLLPLRVRTPFQQHTVESAKRIQQDLQNIGGLTNATTSLWEIKNWTGVVVDTFVNFLTLPDAGKTHDGEGVTIAPTSDWSEGVNRVKEHEEMFQDGDEERMRTLRNESVNSAYLHAIDIEATVRNGMLDVGVFAPVEMLDLAASNKLLEGLKAELGGM